MTYRRRNTYQIAAIVACMWIVGWGNPSADQYATAQDESSVLAGQPIETPELVPAVPTPPQPSTESHVLPPDEMGQPGGMQSMPLITSEPGAIPEEMVPPQAAEVRAIPVARIDYDVTRRARKLFGGSPMVELTMVTQNPADGCFYEIPLCLPACCTGAPKVDSYCGLMGRGVVVYCYECGLEIEVKFRLRGDVEVEYGT